jgi:hypothetical protein
MPQLVEAISTQDPPQFAGQSSSPVQVRAPRTDREVEVDLPTGDVTTPPPTVSSRDSQVPVEVRRVVEVAFRRMGMLMSSRT